jgi:hypothetical protein
MRRMHRKLRYYIKEYWILTENKYFTLQLINHYNHWRSEKWHLIALYRKWSSIGRNYEWYFGLLGFELRFYRIRKKIENN